MSTHILSDDPIGIIWNYRDRMAHDVGFFLNFYSTRKAKSQWHWPSG